MAATTDVNALDVMAGLLAVAVQYRNMSIDDIVRETVRRGYVSAELAARTPTIMVALAKTARAEADERYKYAGHMAGSHSHRNWSLGRLLSENPVTTHHASHQRSPHLRHKHEHPYDLF